MSTVDWTAEHARFMEVAYPKAQRAARRAFCRWHTSKRADSEAEFMAKVWDQWVRLLERDRDPALLLYPLFFWAKRWVQFDRRLSGRPRNLDIGDYRAKMVQHLMDGKGRLQPHDRSDRVNGFLDWTGTARTDDPCELAIALEETGVTLSQWCDL
jgi:hypothetical protein